MAFEKLYTAEDVAEITGLTLRTIRNYIKDGKLKGRRIGVQWRFTEADIQALFDVPLPDTAPGQSAVSTSRENKAEKTEAAGSVSAPALTPVSVPVSQTLAAAEAVITAEEVSLPETEEQVRRFVQRKNVPRTCACAIVDKPGMTEQEARFLYNRLQTLANVYKDTPKRLEVSYTYDENREQARFVFSGAMESACAMMNLCDVQ